MGEQAFQREYTIGQRQWLNHAAREAQELTRAIRARVETGVAEEPVAPGSFSPARAAQRAKALGLTRRERQVLMSMRGKLGRWLKLLAPSVIDRIAAKAIRERH